VTTTEVSTPSYLRIVNKPDAIDPSMGRVGEDELRVIDDLRAFLWVDGAWEKRPYDVIALAVPLTVTGGSTGETYYEVEGSPPRFVRLVGPTLPPPPPGAHPCVQWVSASVSANAHRISKDEMERRAAAVNDYP
jgi:hypothetical protein